MALPHLHDGPNLGGSHGRTVGILSRAIRGQDILSLLSGPPKSGKTTILAATIAGLASEPIQFIKLSNPDGATLEQRDLGSRLIGTPIDGSSLDIVAAVRARLADLANGMQLVIAVDDAQTLSDQAIELLLLLASPVRASRTPPQLILVGEGDFWSRPWRDEWRIIVSMAEHVALRPLTGADARDFVAFELARSGGLVTEVTDDAVARIVHCSRGLPARVNEIVAACLPIAQCRAAPILTGELVEAAIVTIARLPNLASKPRSAPSLSPAGDAKAPASPAGNSAPGDIGEGGRSPDDISPDRVLPIISGDMADTSELHPPEQTVRTITVSPNKLDEAVAARSPAAMPGERSNFDANKQRPATGARAPISMPTGFTPFPDQTMRAKPIVAVAGKPDTVSKRPPPGGTPAPTRATPNIPFVDSLRPAPWFAERNGLSSFMLSQPDTPEPLVAGGNGDTSGRSPVAGETSRSGPRTDQSMRAPWFRHGTEQGKSGEAGETSGSIDGSPGASARYSRTLSWLAIAASFVLAGAIGGAWMIPGTRHQLMDLIGRPLIGDGRAVLAPPAERRATDDQSAASGSRPDQSVLRTVDPGGETEGIKTAPVPPASPHAAETEMVAASGIADPALNVADLRLAIAAPPVTSGAPSDPSDAAVATVPPPYSGPDVTPDLKPSVVIGQATTGPVTAEDEVLPAAPVSSDLPQAAPVVTAVAASASSDGPAAMDDTTLPVVASTPPPALTGDISVTAAPPPPPSSTGDLAVTPSAPPAAAALASGAQQPTVAGSSPHQPPVAATSPSPKDASAVPSQPPPAVASAPILTASTERPPAVPSRHPSAAASLSPAAVEALLRRAEEKLAEGDVLSARLLFERAAATGSEVGMMGAGRTYDPDFLRQLDAPELKSDILRAIEWYRKAAALFGNRAAEERLGSLADAGGR